VGIEGAFTARGGERCSEDSQQDGGDNEKKGSEGIDAGEDEGDVGRWWWWERNEESQGCG